jgi:hypothetical protein
MLGVDPRDQCSSRALARLRVGALATCTLVASMTGCSSAADDEAPSAGEGEPYETSDGNPEAADDGGGSEGGSDGGTSGDDPSGSGGDTSAGEPPPPPGVDDGKFARCPLPLPGSWVFCEDFETITDPRDVVLDYQDGDGAFVLVDGIGASGSHAMEVSYRTGEEEAGWMVLSFGASPIATDGRPSYAPDGSFQEVYWRLRVKTEPGWPSVGPGQLTRTVSFASNDWSEAVVAHLRSAGQSEHVEAVPVTCVSGTDVACAGYDDQAGLESLGAMVGETPLFSDELSGEWHCVEGHLLLNTPGEADGVLEFWIDDELQAGRSDLDLRGSWTDYAINALVVENLWPGGAPAPLRRWIDDVVVSTEPIGCEASPPIVTPPSG